MAVWPKLGVWVPTASRQQNIWYSVKQPYYILLAKAYFQILIPPILALTAISSSTPHRISPMTTCQSSEDSSSPRAVRRRSCHRGGFHCMKWFLWSRLLPQGHRTYQIAISLRVLMNLGGYLLLNEESDWGVCCRRFVWNTHELP